MTRKLLDVTEDARKEAPHLRGWHVAVTRGVWKRCVSQPMGGAKEDEEKRLRKLLMFMWNALGETPFPRIGLLARFRFDTGFSYQRPNDPPSVRLVAIAGINRNGAPQIVVRLPREIVFLPRRPR